VYGVWREHGGVRGVESGANWVVELWLHCVASIAERCREYMNWYFDAHCAEDDSP
jgi:hypothetical protein